MTEDQTGWTGGQWSLLRFVLGMAIATQQVTVAAAGESTVSWVAVGAALALAVGWRTQWAGVALFLIAGLFLDDAARFPSFVIGLAFGMATDAPYGSFDARGRADPGGNWVPGSLVAKYAWLIVAVVAAVSGIHLALSSSRLDAVLGLAQALGAVVAIAGGPRLSTWAALTVLFLGSLMMAADLPLDFRMLASHALAFRPAWVPAVRTNTPLVLFYDGACGFCHRTVRFLLSEDRAEAVHFAPLFGPTFDARVPPDVRATLPDSLVLLTADGSVLVRSRGLIVTARALGGLWRAGAEVLSLLPPVLLDAAYDRFARIRRRLFAQPEGTCPLIPPSLRGRFPDLATERGEVGLDGGA